MLPDTCEVWPGHLGGSLCGGPGMDMKVCSTIGYEQEHQALLQIEDEQEFVETVDSFASAAAAELREHRRVEPWAAGPRERRATAPRAAPGRPAPGGRGACGRRPHRAPVRRGAHSRGGVHDRASRRLRLEARLAGRRRGGGRGDRRARRRRGSPRGHARGGRRPHERRRLPLGRDDLVARGEETGAVDHTADAPRASRPLGARPRRAPGARRSRAARVGLRPHSRLGSRALPRHPPRPGRHRSHPPVAVVCGSGERSAVGASLLQHYGASEVIHVVEGGVPMWKRRGWPIEQPEKTAA